MRSAVEIANWIIVHGNVPDLTNLKLQKLLYVAFGLHVARFDEELFYDPIEAWKYGPVVQSIYHFLSIYGRSTITAPIILGTGEVPMLGIEERREIQSVEDTLRTFGQKTALELVNWSHSKGGAWEAVYDPNRGGLQRIPTARIRTNFAEFIESGRQARREKLSICR